MACNNSSIIIKSLVWCCLFLADATSSHQLLPLVPFLQNHLPSAGGVSGQVQTSIIHHQQPNRQIAAGFHLNPLQPQQQQLRFLPPFPLNPPLYTAVRNALVGGGGNVIPMGRFFAPPLNNLFTPNTVKEERPESKGQDEEYRKFLEEEAEELEKERYQNDITTDFADIPLESIEETSFHQPNKKTFVRLNIHGKDYSYAA